jgi:hypothetical protein
MTLPRLQAWCPSLMRSGGESWDQVPERAGWHMTRTTQISTMNRRKFRWLIVAIIIVVVLYVLWISTFRVRRMFAYSGHEYVLPNGYSIFELSTKNSQIGAPGGAIAIQKGWCRATNPIDGVELLAIDADIVFGIATKPQGDADKTYLGCPGYFWIDTRTHESQVGMSLESWLVQLRSRFGIEDAESKLDTVRILPYLRKNF